MHKSFIKILSILLIVGLNWTGLSAVIETVAYYNDTENSNANTYQAGILDFSLYSTTTNFVPPEIVTSMEPGDSVTREISVIKEENSNIFQYNARTVKTGGDDDFCNALKLEAKLEGVTKYSDGLIGFNLTPPIIIGDDGQDDWFFKVTLPSGTSFPPGKVCQIKFVFDGWQINLPDSSSGFSDREEIDSSFATGGMKINKVYYDVDAEHGSEYANEWIEIYNPLDNPVDISGWIIEDNNSTDTIPSSSPIPAKGFAIITGASSTWDYWDVPANVVKIVLPDGKIGNGLSNEGDRVILKMPNGIEDDAMSYGTDTYAFYPPSPDVDEGHILGRVPTGVDTDTYLDWKDLALPEVVVTYPTGGGWYCNQQVNIRWTATNPNGPNSNLKITLLYIRDLDKNGIVSEGDAVTTIASDIDNTGSYRWTVSPCYYGYVWIKVIAIGPENFMVNSSGLSGRIFEPPAPEDISLPEDCCSIEMFEELIAEYEASLNADNTGLTQDEPIDEVLGEGASTEPEENIILEENVGQEENVEQPVEQSDESESIVPEANNETVGETSEDVGEEVITEENQEGGIEEQPATIPDDSSSNSEGTGESVSDEGNGNGSGDASGVLDGDSSIERVGESSGEVGDADESVDE